MFGPGDRVLVSVSGGPDSVCLLYSLWYLRRLLDIQLEVFHFDHKLRKDSARDGEYVRRLAERLKLPFHLRVAESAPAKGGSIEAWATVARGDAANDTRTKIRARVIAEGHTLDDQAETVLLNLIRGTGLEGMSGIWPALGDRSGRYMIQVQPLIEVEREEVVAFCRAIHLRPRVDPTNQDTKHLRNAIRLEVLPAMERATGREVKHPIVRTADLLRDDRTDLFVAANEVMERVVSGRDGDLRFDAAMLRSIPKTVASRVVRMAIYQVMERGDVAPWTREAVEAVLDLAEGRPGRRRDLPAGLKARRDREYVSVSRTSPESRV